MTTPPSKRGRPRDEGLTARRQEAILEEAARLFAEQGFAAADVQELANRLAVGKGTIYRYFPSKEELFRAAVDRGVRGLNEYLEARVAGVADPLERIEQAILAYLVYFDEHPELPELFIQERAQSRGGRMPAYFANREAAAEPWWDLYRGLVAEGRVRDVADAADLGTVNDLMYGTILANHLTGRRVSPQRQARAIIDIVFQGILTDAERRARSEPAGG
jgi:AcrR family transcriptional regulator